MAARLGAIVTGRNAQRTHSRKKETLLVPFRSTPNASRVRGARPFTVAIKAGCAHGQG